ncbi:Flp family type IVb pilin [Alcaligenes faecalis]|uniref:Flp family type IVb pilin n=1 Tax=Alcaligenes faecalis TaxID=511 RepID=UPI0005A86447|nr:Flp family type IVb pilin [Alcaligenes faecalis]ATI01820.1 Flp family type IVb pilin [Alcaligenes faecalis]AYZ93621.1 Flp family type IVb pilin [Alcaligenes faecalis]MCX5596210.1 Flp family type IVb pilin [Alcaligenes faecalis]QQC30959.1 Flp family type IVb pilin [Alcaligenes faecalis]CAJ0907592.1 pilus assembly protein Flp/PilA [Alcaligenes faecalis subsp. faecalis]
MKTQLQQFWNDEDGATAIEYGLIAGLVAVAIIGVLGLLGDGLKGLFTRVTGELNTASEVSE